jgi:F-type H+-transporting ATPase subunit b
MTLFALTDASSSLRGGESPVEVSFDLTALIMVGLFILLMLVLKPLLFDPMLKLFEERETRTVGTIAKARAIDEISVQAETKYQTEMAKARAAGNAARERLRAEGLRAENELLSKVRQATSKTLEEGKQQALAEAEKVRATLRVESVQLAKDLASRVLGREVQG